MAEIDLYNFRGFKVYTPELPDAPATPVYDIKLWLSFAEGADGLISCDPYDTDYCDGEWLQYIQSYNGTTVSSAIPKDFVSTDDNPNTGTKYLTWPTHGVYDKAYPQIKTNVTYPENGFTIGSWVYTDKTKDNTRLPMIYLYDSLGGSIYMNYYATYWTAGLSGGTYVYASQDLTTGWYFVQWYFDYTNNTIALKVNGNNVSLDSSELPSAWQLLDCVQINIDMQSPYKDATGINNIIYSEDLTLDMYATMRGESRLCNLTEYPKLIAPTITTHPQSEDILEGQSFSELTVAASSNGGGTLTYQWQSYSGSAWSDIEGEETDAYTPTAAGTYRCVVSNSKGSVNSNSAVLTETEEIDYMEYATDGAAQAAYVTSAANGNLIPDMTSDSTPSGTASASSVIAAGYEAYKSMDRDSTTYWFSSGNVPQWVKYAFTAEKTVTGYAITAPNDGNYVYAPRDWTVQDQDDTVLDTQADIAFTQGERKEYELSSPASCESIKLVVADTNYTPDSYRAMVAEFEALVEQTLQCYSESTIKTQGSYSLKGVAGTSDLNTTFTHTFDPALNLTGIDYANFNIRSSRTGSNIKLGLHDTGGTTTEITPNITSANEWQNVEWDLSGVSDANKNAVDTLTITIVNADAANTFYIDNFKLDEPEFLYSQQTTISHASEPTNQQVMFTINRSEGTSSGTTIYVGTDCTETYSDVRFYCDDVLLDYWIQEYTSSTAKIWVKFPEILDHDLDLVVKYGNANLTSGSSGLNTFAAFEDFSSSVLDTGKWTNIAGSGVSIATGVCTIQAASNDSYGISLIDTIGTNYRLLARVKPKHSNTTSYLESIQFYDGTHQIAAYYCHVSAEYNHQYEVYDGSSEANPDMVGDTADTWIIQEIIRNGAVSQIFTIDGSNTTTVSIANLTEALNIKFAAYGSGSEIAVDWMAVGKYLATAPTIGEWSGQTAAGDILFGTHFDSEDDWNTSQNASLLDDWDQKTADNEGGGTYEAGYIAQHGESSGKCLKQYWDTGTSTAQNCWLIKNSISIPDEFWLGYRFKVDTNWDWGSATSLKIMKLHYDNGTTLDINWCSSHYEMPSPYTPPGGGYSIATDATGKNWFGHWTDIDDGAWHTFVWHFKHSTNTLECFIDSVDAALTSETPAFPGSGWDDGSESGYALSFGGNLSGGGGGVDEMYTKYDDVCIGTTRAKVEEYLGI